MKGEFSKQKNSKQIGSMFNEYSDHTVQYLLLDNLHRDNDLRYKTNFRNSAFVDQRVNLTGDTMSSTSSQLVCLTWIEIFSYGTARQ
jgi:hypothetical protein